MITLVINGSFIGKRITGTQRFAVESTRALLQLKKTVKVMVVDGIKLPDWLPESQVIRVPCFSSSRAIRFFTYWVVAPFYLDAVLSAEYTVWSPCNNGSIFFKNHIVTIHDMAVRAGPEWFSFSFMMFYRFCFSWYEAFPYQFTTVSKFSKSEIIKYYNINPRLISIIPNATSEFKPSSKMAEDTRLPSKFILSVASVDPRKNTGLIVQAWNKLTNLERNMTKLVLVGGAAKVFKGGGIDLSCRDVINLGYVSDGELDYLYNRAQFLILASKYEGFGLPIIEALSRGSVVLCSDIPAFCEVGGNNVHYFLRENIESLAGTMANLLRLPKSMIKAQINHRSWQTVGCQLWLLLAPQVAGIESTSIY